ncbi:MAG: carboxypeptidase regulatory-like domain-containing protein [Bacteroidetes bacterium]|nr:carboxypeptidase regulatory-like domain-containing protein [Bacteroidota bacterium]
MKKYRYFFLLFMLISFRSFGVIFTGATTFTADTTDVYPPSTNNPIIGLRIDVQGGAGDLYLTQIVIDAALCTNYSSDVSQVQIYCTGSDSVFIPLNLFWSGTQLPLPCNGVKMLQPGANYFWICFSVSVNAYPGDILDAECLSFTLSDQQGPHVPTITSPPGSRTIHSTAIQPRKISGRVLYDNAANTPLNGVLVMLNSGYTLAQVNTNANGYYQFLGLDPGVYQLIVLCYKPWGGVNAVDALTILRHFVGMETLSGLRLKAADVDFTEYVNSGDALQVLMRFTGIITTFPLGDWIFEDVMIELDGTMNITRNIRGLCVGDVNRSYIPAAK